ASRPTGSSTARSPSRPKRSPASVSAGKTGVTSILSRPTTPKILTVKGQFSARVWTLLECPRRSPGFRVLKGLPWRTMLWQEQGAEYVSTGFTRRVSSALQARRPGNQAHRGAVHPLVSGEPRAADRTHCSAGVGDYASDRGRNWTAQQ